MVRNILNIGCAVALSAAGSLHAMEQAVLPASASGEVDLSKALVQLGREGVGAIAKGWAVKAQGYLEGNLPEEVQVQVKEIEADYNDQIQRQVALQRAGVITPADLEKRKGELEVHCRQDISALCGRENVPGNQRPLTHVARNVTINSDSPLALVSALAQVGLQYVSQHSTIGPVMRQYIDLAHDTVGDIVDQNVQKGVDIAEAYLQKEQQQIEADYQDIPQWEAMLRTAAPAQRPLISSEINRRKAERDGRLVKLAELAQLGNIAGNLATQAAAVVQGKIRQVGQRVAEGFSNNERLPLDDAFNRVQLIEMQCAEKTQELMLAIQRAQAVIEDLDASDEEKRRAQRELANAKYALVLLLTSKGQLLARVEMIEGNDPQADDDSRPKIQAVEEDEYL